MKKIFRGHFFFPYQITNSLEPVAEKFLQLNDLLCRKSQRGIWWCFWAMNSTFSGRAWWWPCKAGIPLWIPVPEGAAEGYPRLPHFFLGTTLQCWYYCGPTLLTGARRWHGIFKSSGSGKAGLVPGLSEPELHTALAVAERGVPTALPRLVIPGGTSHCPEMAGWSEHSHICLLWLVPPSLELLPERSCVSLSPGMSFCQPYFPPRPERDHWWSSVGFS